MTRCITVAASLLLTFALAHTGCSTATSNLAIFGDTAADSAEPIHERQTILNYGDGETEDVGLRRYAESTEEFMQLFPMSAIMFSDSGYVIGFSPTLGPVDGVVAPAAGMPLQYIVVDTRGRLVDWQEAEAAEPDCKLVKVIDPITGSSYYACQNLRCTSPRECVITFRYNPDGTLIEITCPCTAVP